MELQTGPSSLSPKHSSSSNVDTSRPFRSVKEAVAVFGERLLTGELYGPRRPSGGSTTTNNTSPLISQNNPVFEYQETPWRSSAYASSSPSTKAVCSTTHEEDDDDYENDNDLKVDVEVFDTLRKLETELEETKKELKLLKDRESETEIAIANLNADLHKTKSKLAEAEAEAAAVAVTRNINYEAVGKGVEIVREEAKRRELMKRMEENNQTLAEILSISSGEKEAYKLKKKKPIVPLVGDFFVFRKKTTSSNDHDHGHSIYGAPPVYFN